jgi:23S rRNA pseudouridine955/2504/2580 synthase
MRTFIVSGKDAGKRVDRFIMGELDGLLYPLLLKTFRKRDVKVNGSRVKGNYILSAGERVEIYLSDDILNKNKNVNIPVVYEDDNILIVDKPKDIPVQDEKDVSIEKLLRAAKPSDTASNDFPALCHRLDRNTSGLLLLAKNQQVLEIIFEKFKSREIKKTYRCVVIGCPEKPFAELNAFLVKNPDNSLVKIYNKKVPGSVPIQTNYRVVETNGSLSLLEVELVTGRTHQIRAHMAFAGFPVLGDGKYGKNSINRKYGFKKQLLQSTCLEFPFTTDASILNYLKGKSFTLPVKSLEEIISGRVYY